MRKMKTLQGSMALSNNQGIVSPAYYVSEFTNYKFYKFYKSYFHYLLRNLSYLPEYERLSGGLRIGQWDLSCESFQNLPFLIPLFTTQQKIAEYLYTKCTAIDNAISKKSTLIEQLKEYKKSLIYECVTGKREVYSK